MSGLMDFGGATSAYRDYTPVIEAGGQEIQEMGSALMADASAMEDLPVSRRVVEMVRDLANSVHRMGEEVSAAVPAFQKMHAADIERHEKPRTGEEGWDVRSQ